MELKDYQEGVLDRLSEYLNILKEKKQNTLELAKFIEKKKSSVNWASSELNFCSRTWDELNEQRLIPL